MCPRMRLSYSRFLRLYSYLRHYMRAFARLPVFTTVSFIKPVNLSLLTFLITQMTTSHAIWIFWLILQNLAGDKHPRNLFYLFFYLTHQVLCSICIVDICIMATYVSHRYTLRPRQITYTAIIIKWCVEGSDFMIQCGRCADVASRVNVAGQGIYTFKWLSGRLFCRHLIPLYL